MSQTSRPRASSGNQGGSPKVFHLPALGPQKGSQSSISDRRVSSGPVLRVVGDASSSVLNPSRPLPSGSSIAIRSTKLGGLSKSGGCKTTTTTTRDSKNASRSGGSVIDSTRPLNRTQRGKGRQAGTGGSTADAKLWGAVALMQHMSKSFTKAGAILQPSSTPLVTGGGSPPAVSYRTTAGVGSNTIPKNNSNYHHYYNPMRPTGYSNEGNHPKANIHLNIDTQQVKLTLAQKMGLVEAPPAPPEEEIWEVAQKKAVHRGDALHPCSICHESFALMGENVSAQVILDCSHVFHLTCLKQFEKFTKIAQGRDFVRQCPVCRHGHYHKRIHYAGRAQIQNHAAAKIQGVIRGVLARKRYLKMRLAANPKFKSDYYFNKLSDMSDAYLSYAVAREKEVDIFLEEVDLQRQRAVADMMTPKDWSLLQTKAINSIKQANEAKEKKKRDMKIVSIKYDGSVGDCTFPLANDFDDEMGSDTSCPICMNDVAIENEEGASAKTSERTPFLLSCGHCFHGHCLTTFESFTQAARATKAFIPRCPLCRSGYVKRRLLVE